MIQKVGGQGWDCNQFILKDPNSNSFDLVDAGNGVDFGRVYQEIAPYIDPKRIRSIAITHEHLDHVNGLPLWQELGAKIITSPAVADKLARGHDPTSEMFGNKIPTLTVDAIVADGDNVSLGGENYEVLLTPGHSPGSTCFWGPKNGHLFTGDTVFANGGIGRFDFPDGNVHELAESILRLEKLPAKVLHCGHGPCVEAGADACLRGSVAFVQSCV
jgi:hydroxyacylglutathione hydrolase